MHNETLEKLTNAAKNKINMLNNSKLKYLVSSAFAGLYVGLGIILIFTVGGLLLKWYLYRQFNIKIIFGKNLLQLILYHLFLVYYFLLF